MKKFLSCICVFAVLMGAVSGCAINISGDDDESEPAVQSDSGNSSAEAPSSEGGSVNPAAPDSQSLYVTGTDKQIAIREVDEDSGKVIGQLSKGDEVKLLSTDSMNYYCILHEPTGVQGYVKKAYLTEESSAVCNAEECYIEHKTELYDTREENHKTLEELSVGTAVTVLAKTSGDYWFVGLSDSKTYGYVKCSDLSTTKPVASSKTTSSKASSSSSVVSVTPPKVVPPSGPSYYTGSGSAPTSYLYTKYAKVQTGYLGLRSSANRPAGDTNVIGQMYTGYRVYVIDTSTGNYWYCYCPELGMYGFTDSAYLSDSVTSVPPQTEYYETWNVIVETGYLAVRTSPQRANDTNIKGRLYTGDIVYVYDYSFANFTDTYWYVYCPSLDMWGYVDSNKTYPPSNSKY